MDNYGHGRPWSSNSHRNSASSIHSFSPGSSRYSMSSLPSPATHRVMCLNARAKTYKFFRRLTSFHQMDFESAAWQAIYLFISPQTVYRDFSFRKHTKAQFARDDPAFLVLLGIFLLVSCAGFGLVLRMTFLEYITLVLYVVFVDCVITGVIMCSLLWLFCNKYLLKPGISEDNRVEWAYCFDVHLNALFPALVILHGVMIVLYHALIGHDWTISVFIGNTLWLAAVGYYTYITFLGYSCLQQLQSTRLFLYPFTLLTLIYLIALMTGTNISTTLVQFYQFRVL